MTISSQVSCFHFPGLCPYFTHTLIFQKICQLVQNFTSLVVVSVCADHCVVRVPVLYGHTEENGYGESAINVLVNAVRSGKECFVDDAQIRFPTHVIDVARFCKQLLTVHFSQVGLIFKGSQIYKFRVVQIKVPTLNINGM